MRDLSLGVTCVCVCIYIYIYVCMYVCMHACMYVRSKTATVRRRNHFRDETSTLSVEHSGDKDMEGTEGSRMKDPPTKKQGLWSFFEGVFRLWGSRFLGLWVSGLGFELLL